MMTLVKPFVSRPKIRVVPRNPSEAFIKGGLNSATPTPMIFSSSLCVDSDSYSDCRTFSGLLAEALGSPTFSSMAFSNNSLGKRGAADVSISEEDEKPALEEMRKTDADSQSISSARYKAMMPPRLPITSASPHLTISPGISPATLLESPIFFSMSQTDMSPTTGTFPIVPSTHDFINAGIGADCVNSPERNDGFIFKPHLSREKYGSPADMGLGAYGMPAEESAKFSDGELQPSHMSCDGLLCDDVPAPDLTCRQASSFSSGVVEPQDHLESTSMVSAAVLPLVTKLSNGRLSTDGYNWKKYGQKTLRNSENPRSYYKCTHPNCLAKKLVECSLEGEVTEIVYKGNHSHAKPQCTGKRARSGTLAMQNSTGAYQDRIVQDSNASQNINYAKASGDFPSSYVNSHGGLQGTAEFSFTSPNNEDIENGEASMVGDDGEDEDHSKHRRVENDMEGFSRESGKLSRGARVVVQTVSEKDNLDDGYRWRKYGQKIVKGQRYPRNYYKCTNLGCKVRKHVERSSTDSKCVLTTYEAKHNHSVPPPRGSARGTEEDAIALSGPHPASPAYTRSEDIYAF